MSKVERMLEKVEVLAGNVEEFGVKEESGCFISNSGRKVELLWSKVERMREKVEALAANVEEFELKVERGRFISSSGEESRTSLV